MGVVEDLRKPFPDGAGLSFRFFNTLAPIEISKIQITGLRPVPAGIYWVRF